MLHNLFKFVNLDIKLFRHIANVILTIMKSKEPLSKHSQKLFENGFTIVELLVVIVVIGILAAITIVSYTGITQKAIASSLQSDLANASQQLKMFQIENSAYPTANNCPNPATGEICLKSSPGVVYNYIVNNSSNIQTFILNASKDSQSYSVGNNNAVANGGINLLTGDTSVEKSSGNEFTQYYDLAPIFDAYGLKQYTISFDIKSANTSVQNTMQVYLQNGSGARHGFFGSVPVTTSYSRQSATATPYLENSSLTQSILAFYGTYGTGNRASVKNVKVEIGSIATSWSQAP